LSFDQSGANAPATKFNNAFQLVQDLLSAYGGNDGSLTSPPTQAQIEQTLKMNVVPQLVKAREGFEQDSPAENESDYTGPNGDAIKMFDREIAFLAAHNNIPVGYHPPLAKKPPGPPPTRSPVEWDNCIRVYNYLCGDVQRKAAWIAKPAPCGGFGPDVAASCEKNNAEAVKNAARMVEGCVKTLNSCGTKPQGSSLQTPLPARLQ
jgi:hypothetical protein